MQTKMDQIDESIRYAMEYSWSDGDLEFRLEKALVRLAISSNGPLDGYYYRVIRAALKELADTGFIEDGCEMTHEELYG
jgi:hypothetical protein